MTGELIRHDWTKEDYGEYRKRIVRESQRRRRAKAKEEGKCSICATYPADPGRKTCRYCYDRVVEWNNKNRGKA